MATKKVRGRTRVTPLDMLERDKNIIRSPMHKLGSLTSFSSWVDLMLADCLWTVLLTGLLTREKALANFRAVIEVYTKDPKKFGNALLSHSQLATMSDEAFDLLFQPLCRDNEVREALLPLRALGSIPDRHHWKRIIPESPTWEDIGERLATAVARNFDHQSQEATDCRWLRVMSFFAAEKLFVGEGEHFREILEYPNRGDMRSVRPTIRAMEMSTRTPDIHKGAPAIWSEEFWEECWRNSGCITRVNQRTARPDHRQLLEEIIVLHDDLSEHFIRSVQTTRLDPKHDGSFGIVFYIIHLLVYALNAANGQTVASRSILRTAIEAYITLSFLVKKDDQTIWLQYRNYGSGQIKLAMLKNVSERDMPSFLSAELLERLANEDMWTEFQDIKLGAWSDKNLRRMSEEAGVKDIYDRYYDTLSGYVHANWIAVRHSVFEQCMNPLHRFHRVPSPPRPFDEDAVPDLRKIVNLALDKLSSLYPPFKARLPSGGTRAGHPEREPDENSEVRGVTP